MITAQSSVFRLPLAHFQILAAQGLACGVHLLRLRQVILSHDIDHHHFIDLSDKLFLGCLSVLNAIFCFYGGLV
jgi:hypothetical protein